MVRDASREVVRAMIDAACEREADAVVFGCTEIGMLFPPTAVGLPGYDTLDLPRPRPGRFFAWLTGC